MLLCVCVCVCVYRELWRREAGIDQTIQNARDELTKCERNLRATMGKVRKSLYLTSLYNIYIMLHSRYRGLLVFSICIEAVYIVLDRQ